MDKNKDNPLRLDQVKELVKPREALSISTRSLRQHFYAVGSAQAPEVKVRVVRGQANAAQPDTFDYDIVVDVVGARVDQRAQGRPAELSLVRRPEARAALSEQRPSFDPFIPAHLAVAPLPELSREEPRRAAMLASDPLRRIPTTVFSPDERKVFQDIKYPWGTIGRVQTARGVGSGVMVGPRHLLTVSHVVDWGGPTGVGALRFTPGYYNGSQPFGQAIATRIYSYVKENGDGGLDPHEQQFDYVIAVLDTRIGESCGWMGTRSYTDAWDGQPFWSHAGYPSGLTSAQRPTYQHQIAMDGDNQQADAHEAIFHRGDVEPGQSGGPVFAWFDNGPCAVAVQSWQNAETNGASGGSDMLALLHQALNENP